jgi:GAF domain-containing protein
MTAGSFREAYAAAFDEYVAAPSEAALRTAYELGRDAVERGLSVLELASLHHDVLAIHLRGATSGAAVEHVAVAAGDFFAESLASFELLQQSFHAARESALLEQRQAALLRRLSSFLADASLAAHSSDSIDELLQLVAEQARELLGADCCVVEVGSSSHAVCTDDVVSDAPDPAQLALIYPHVRGDRGVVRLTRAQAEHDPACAPLVAAGLLRRGWLAAPLTTLDGRQLGLLHVCDKGEGAFSELDEELLVELAQMTSAAVERMQHYSGVG